MRAQSASAENPVESVSPPVTPPVETATLPPRDDAFVSEVVALVNRERTRVAGGWGRAIAILLVSMAAFYGLGLLHFRPMDIGLFLAIVLFHELGHLLAMRLFGYRDLRILFIPFFGGAAAGRKDHAPGWQRAVVALAGPIPGLVAGYALLIAYFYNSVALCGITSLLLIAINGLNLLPVFPLDGGRFLNDVLFCRNRFAELGFRAVTALLVLVIGVLVGDRVFMILGGVFLLGLIFVARLARASAEIGASVPPNLLANANSPSIDPDLVSLMMPHLPLPSEGQGHRSPNTAALLIRGVLDRLQMQPPTAAASVALMFAYLVSLLSVLIVPMLVVALAGSGTIPTPQTGPLKRFVDGFREGFESVDND